MKKTTKHRLPGMACPHCESPATVRFARQLSAVVREVTYRCENDECGHGFVAQLAAIRTTIPSVRPNPSVHLPFAAPTRATRPAANDGGPVKPPPAANDTTAAMTG